MTRKDLQPITGTLFYFTCYGCGQRARSDGLPLHHTDKAEGPPMADLNGPAFRAWYCGKCAERLRKETQQ